MRRALSLGVLVAVAGGAPGGAAAGPEHRTVVYQGHLDVDGVPVNAPTDMTFAFFPVATGGSPIVTLEKPKVPVVNGKFAVQLVLPDAVLDADPVYLQVTVGGAVLPGRRRLSPAAFALRGRGDGTFVTDAHSEVKGHLAVQGSQVVEGRTEVKGKAAANHLAVRGTDLTLGTGGSRTTGSIPYQRALVHGPADVLYVNQAGDFEGGTAIQSATIVQGPLWAASNLNVNGTANLARLQFQTFAWLGAIVAENEGPWGAWSPMVFCPRDTYACGFRQKVEPTQPDDDTALNAIQLACCYFGAP